MSIKVLCFTIPGFLQIMLGDGTLLNKVALDAEDNPKDILMGEGLNAGLAEKLGTADFSTIWIEDPAGDAEVLEACRLMEKKQVAVRAAVSEPKDDGTISVHTKGVVFEEQTDDSEFQMVDPETLGIGDVCRFVADGQEPSGIYEVVATAIHTGAEDSGDFLIQLKPIIAEEPAPKFAPPSHGKKVIEVECEVSKSEGELRRLIRDMQSLEIEANASAADYREQIKAAKKRIYDLSNGKAYTSMECDVINDWEAGKRGFIRPDTGAVVRVEEISMEERQLNLDKELEEATPAAVEDVNTHVEEAVPDQPPEQEAAAESSPTDDFPDASTSDDYQ